MSAARPVSSPDGAPGRLLPLVLPLFVGSGCAALIYEIVWFQLLQNVIGATAVSLGVLLGVYMGGMGLGSLLLPRLVARRMHPLRVYAVLEAGIGVCGLLVLVGLPMVSAAYLKVVGHGFGEVLLRGVVCAVCLLPPTVLMGATLPAISRWVESGRAGVSWLGFFYGGNIAGAVFGSLLAGFYLLRVYDMPTATFAAVAINFAVALGALALSAIVPALPAETEGSTPTPSLAVSANGDGDPFVSPRLVYLAIGLSGLTALGAEVVWTRTLSLLLGGTVYAFSIILAVFLAGLGLGSAAGAYFARTSRRPQLGLGVCQFLLVGGIAWTAYMLTASLPYWPVDLDIASTPLIRFQLDLARCLWAILPPTLLWGASFPLALAAVVRGGQDPGRLVGGVYAANTLGAITGALAFSFWGPPGLGSQDSERALILLTLVSALLILAPRLWPRSPVETPAPETARTGVGGLVLLLLLPVAAGLLTAGVKALPAGVIGYGRFFASYKPGTLPKFLYVGEGLNSSVAVSEYSADSRNFHVSGKVEASTEPQDMRLQRMLGHLPALSMPAPKSVLIVGCGAGVTAGSFLTYPSIQRIVICEIEPLVPRVVAHYFSAVNYGIVDGVDEKNPRTINGKQVEVVYDDGRHYLLTTAEKFDIITSDPIHPWVKGSASLYTKEYFELVKQHLNPGGFITQWVPLYESSPATVKSELRTFFDVFPEGMIWGNEDHGQGYDTVVMGQNQPAPIDLAAVALRLASPKYAPVAESLRDVGFGTLAALYGTYAGRGPDFTQWLQDAEINRDRNLRLQYLAGLDPNSQHDAEIYRDILSRRTKPVNVFDHTPPDLQAYFNTMHATSAP